MTQIIAIPTAACHATIPGASVARDALPLLQPPATTTPPRLRTGPLRTGPLRNGNPRGNPNLAARCGAKARTTGCPCQAPAMANGRCRLHGGKSTGPRTPKGLASLAKARTTHGNSTAAARAERRYVRTVITRSQVLVAAMDARPYLPSEIRRRLELGADELAAPPLPALLPTTPAHNHPDHGTGDQAPAPILPPTTTPPDAHGLSTPRDAHGRFTTRPRPVPRGQQAEREAAREERAMLVPWRAGIKRARMIRRLLTLQAQNAHRAERAQSANPSLPPATRPADGTPQSDTVAAGHPPIDDRSRGGPPAPRMQIEPTERNAIQRETMPDPAQPAKDSDKTLMQRDTVAPPTGPAETAGEISDRTSIQRGTVPRPAHPPGPAGEGSDRTPGHRDTAAPPGLPATAQADGSDKTSIHRGIVPPGPNPFRQALLAGTISNDPEAHQLAALAERAGGWPVMIAAAAEQRAGRDWRPAAAAARQGLQAGAARPTARSILHPAPIADLVRNAITPPTEPATLAIGRPLRDSTPPGQVKSARAP